MRLQKIGEDNKINGHSVGNCEMIANVAATFCDLERASDCKVKEALEYWGGWPEMYHFIGMAAAEASRHFEATHEAEVDSNGTYNELVILFTQNLHTWMLGKAPTRANGWENFDFWETHPGEITGLVDCAMTYGSQEDREAFLAKHKGATEGEESNE